MSKKFVAVCLLITALLTMVTTTAATPAEVGQGNGPANYIVVFRNNVNVNAAVPEVARAHGLSVSDVYRHAIHGMSVNVPEGRLNALRRDPRVLSVEPNYTVEAQGQVVPTSVGRVFATSNANIGINGVDDVRVDVDVAVLDTGIAAHPDLNVVGRFNCIARSKRDTGCIAGGVDGNGHGTHIGGIIGALDNGDGVVGVAPGARLWALKVLSDSKTGQLADVVAALDWVIANKSTIEVVNMSLVCGCTSSAFVSAVTNTANAGVVVVVAAGNSNVDAGLYTPANHPSVLTVSAIADFDGAAGGSAASTCYSDVDDTRWNSSNWGSVVDITASGVCIYSTHLNGGYATLTGTSMASPVVAGAAALLASRSNPNTYADVVNIYNTLKSTGTMGYNAEGRDSWQEPLVDVSNSAVFNPVQLPR